MTTNPDPRDDRVPAGRAGWRRPRTLLIAGAAVLVALMLVSTTYRSAGDPTPGENEAFDPARYAAENYNQIIVPAIRQDAVPIATLLPALGSDLEAAGEQYGKRAGSGPFSYAVSVAGTAGTPENGLLPIEVSGAGDTRISVQIGPAVNGSALRDASGKVKFGDFTNQVEYADAATALNQQMAKELLAKTDVAALSGAQVEITGAMTVLSADVLTITPVEITAAP